MRILLRTGLLGALALIAACGSDHGLTVPTPTAPTVHGTLRDYQTQAPLARTTILFTTDVQSSNGYRAVTDDSGHYSMPQPPQRPQSRGYYIWVDSTGLGTGYFAGPSYRGDVLMDTGTCVARYGQVFDANTLKPISGATVWGISSTTTGSDGWYRLDWGCPATGTIGFNTSVLNATSPGYTSVQLIIGRGISHVERLDILLKSQ